MKHMDLNYAVSLLLLLAIIATGITGYIQSQMELRKFIPHRYFAYATLLLTTLHVCLNTKKIYQYLRHRFKRKY